MGSKYSLVFVGPNGHGKSSTANKIAEENLFTTGNRAQTVTLTVSVAKVVHNELFGEMTLCDCPPFSDCQTGSFLSEFQANKNVFLDLAPISAFLMVIKFDQEVSCSFYAAAKPKR